MAQCEVDMQDLCDDEGFEQYVDVAYEGKHAGKLQIRANFKAG